MFVCCGAGVSGKLRLTEFESSLLGVSVQVRGWKGVWVTDLETKGNRTDDSDCVSQAARLIRRSAMIQYFRPDFHLIMVPTHSLQR